MDLRIDEPGVKSVISGEMHACDCEILASHLRLPYAMAVLGWKAFLPLAAGILLSAACLTFAVRGKSFLTPAIAQVEACAFLA
jgi:hypothetical protein